MQNGKIGITVVPVNTEDVDVPLPPMQHSVDQLPRLGADAPDLSERT